MNCADCKKPIKENAEYATSADKAKGFIPHIIYDPDTGKTVANLCHKCFKVRCPTHKD